jgi:mRNA interferase RelE/StbE
MEMDADEGFGSQDLESIDAGLAELAGGQVLFQTPDLASARLLDLWSPGEPETAAAAPREPLAGLRLRPYPDLLYRPRELRRVRRTWDLGFTHDFCKAIQNIDRKLQGRVLEALRYISTTPTVPMGDKVKPLSGNYEGLWRYRVGDYRIIYRADTDNGRVVLITIVSRGAAYA